MSDKPSDRGKPPSPSPPSMSSLGRIPKRRDLRDRQEQGEPEPKRGFVLPNSTNSSEQESFAAHATEKVQTNMFALNIEGMAPKLRRLFFEATVVLPNGKTFCLNDGLVAVSGDVNSHHRRIGQYHLFRKVHSKYRDSMFAGKDLDNFAYDNAATIYTPENCFSGSEVVVCELKQADFDDNEWKVVSKLARRKEAYFSIKVGLDKGDFVYTKKMGDVANWMELTRAVEIITSQILNSPEFLQFGNKTFPINQPPLDLNDHCADLRAGFAKVSRVVEGPDGRPEVLMTIDSTRSPFYKPTSVIRFALNKLEEINNPIVSTRGGRGGRGGFRGGRGGYGGGFGGSSYGSNDRNRDRRDNFSNRGGHHGGRSDRRDSYQDSRSGRSDRDSYGRGRDDYGGRRHDDRHVSRDSRNSRDRRDAPRTSRRSPSPPQDTQSDYTSADVSRLDDYLTSDRPNTVKDLIDRGLNGLYLEAVHLSGGANSIINAYGLAPSNAENTVFTHVENDIEQEISVKQYFMMKYNIHLRYPKFPLVYSKRMKTVNYFPMELLRIIPGQRINAAKMSANLQGAMTGQNSAMPLDHVKLIQNILMNSLCLENNKYLKSFGIGVRVVSGRDGPMIPSRIIKAKIIFPAEIKFKEETCTPQPGNVRINPRTPHFVRPARIRIVGVILFDGIPHRDGVNFCRSLAQYCEETGIRVDHPHDRWPIREMDASDHSALKKRMVKWKDDRVSIVIGICKDKKPDVHDIVKYYEESIGIQTLQLSKDSVDKMISGGGGKQTSDNVMRKFNLKCGGTNFHVKVSQNGCHSATNMQKKIFSKTQFVGFEISHGTSRTLYDRSRNQMDGEPATVGVSYSLKHSTALGGFSYMQTQGQYQLQKLSEKFPDCIKAYNEDAGYLPEKIVIYRAGIGEGDFEKIREEVEEIRSTFAKIEEGYAPKLVVLVAQKNSHLRIFPEKIRFGKASEQNVKSGTCIDNLPTSGGSEEFILVSQSAMIGTVRPCKYSILINDPSWTKNEIINLTYYLAFGHQVSYQPPGVPDILYAAENLAKRGKNNWSVHKRFVNMQDEYYMALRGHEHLIDQDMGEDLADAIVSHMSEEMNAMTISRRNFWA